MWDIYLQDCASEQDSNPERVLLDLHIIRQSFNEYVFHCLYKNSNMILHYIQMEDLYKDGVKDLYGG